MKALVLGGYGAVGRLVATELREFGDVAVAAGRDAAHAALVGQRAGKLLGVRSFSEPAR